MLKLAVLIWLVLGITLAGAGVMVVVAVPELFNDGMQLIPIAAAIGAVVAIPFAYLIARRIYLATATR